MNIIRAFRALGPVDYRSVRRDSLLSWIVFLPLVIAVALRIFIPVAAQLLDERAGVRLADYNSLINSLLFLIMPMLVGMVIGFLLLDQRDDGTLTALQVTPLTLSGYLAYRLALPSLLAIVTTLVMVPLTGIGQPQWGAVALASLAAAPQAPLFALFYAVFAQNKVQGFAVMKASGVIMLPPVAAYFISGPLHWLFGLVPTFWPAKVYWLAADGSPLAWPALVVGLALQVLIGWWLVKKYQRVMVG